MPLVLGFFSKSLFEVTHRDETLTKKHFFSSSKLRLALHEVCSTRGFAVNEALQEVRSPRGLLFTGFRSLKGSLKGSLATRFALLKAGSEALHKTRSLQGFPQDSLSTAKSIQSGLHNLASTAWPPRVCLRSFSLQLVPAAWSLQLGVERGEGEGGDGGEGGEGGVLLTIYALMWIFQLQLMKYNPVDKSIQLDIWKWKLFPEFSITFTLKQPIVIN